MAKKTFILNDVVRCFSYGYSSNYQTLVTIQQNANKTVTQELVHDAYDWATYRLPLNQLKEADKLQLADVILNVGGNIDSFLFRDEFGMVGNKIERNTIGNKVTSGTETFQAKRTYSIAGETDRLYDVWNIEEALGLSVWVGGSLLTELVDYTVTYIDSGEIEITAADTGDVEIEGYFLRRCRFNGSPDAMLNAFDLTNVQLGIKEESIY